MTINIFGAGTWGIVIATYLSRNGHDVLVYHRNSQKTKNLIKSYKHPNLLKYKIPKTIQFTNNINELDSNNLNILAVPTHALSECLSKIEDKNSKFLILSKGFDLDSGLLPSELLTYKFNISINNIAVLSGPNHAEEIVQHKPTATIISSIDSVFSKELQLLFTSEILRVYTTSDIIGVQIGAAVKNIIAIASGLCVGFKLGDNALASLVSRGMNEIIELSKVYKIKIITLYGLSGLGDLVGTCYSIHSRNRKLGILLSEGKTLIEAKKIIEMVSEGVNTSKILNTIICEHHLEMPICSEVFNILFNNVEPSKSINNLMQRKLKNEN